MTTYLVVSGSLVSGRLLKTNGQPLQTTAVLVSAVVAGTNVLCSEVGPVTGGGLAVVQENGQNGKLFVQQSTGYADGDYILTVAEPGVYECVGADRQPVVLFSALGSLVFPG